MLSHDPVLGPDVYGTETCQSDPQLRWSLPPSLLTHSPLPFLPLSLPPSHQTTLKDTYTHNIFKFVDFIVTISEPFSVRFTVYRLTVSLEPSLKMVAALYTLLYVQYYMQRQHCPCSLVPGLLYSDSSFSSPCFFSLVSSYTVEWLILSS